MHHARIAALLAALALALVPAAAARPAAKAPAFPVTLTVANGKVTIPQQPKRIVSLSPSATESLYAVGAGAQVVAVDDQSDYPARAPRTKISGYKPNAEAIAAYKPDLVVVRADVNGVVPALGKLRIPTLVLPEARHLNEAWGQIRQLGKATGHGSVSDGLVRQLRAQVRQLVASVPKGGPKLTVYHELTTDYYAAASTTFIGRIYSLFGLENIADAADKTGSGYPQLSGEYIVSSSPDLIFLADVKCCGQNAKTVGERPGWSGIAAVRNGHVVTLDDDVASRWGPRVIQLVRAVAEQATAARR